ncbi:hypothetical protein B0H11DRAFT_2259923 [Mycena galericulata]|nr:hypothetical protein B0H11DRAFT_2259923 [Mycena galericulata]
MLFEAMLSRSFEPRSSSRSSLAGTNTLQMCGYSRTRTARREFADGAACAAGVSAQFSRLPLRFMFRSSDVMPTRWDVPQGASRYLAKYSLAQIIVPVPLIPSHGKNWPARVPWPGLVVTSAASTNHKFRRVQRYPCVSAAGLRIVVVDAQLSTAPLRCAQCARTACTARVVGAPSGVWIWDDTRSAGTCHTPDAGLFPSRGSERPNHSDLTWGREHILRSADGDHS